MHQVIWLITHNAVPPKYENRIRPIAMAKYLMRLGYDVTIFGSSVVHNTDINLIEDGSLYVRKEYGNLKFIHINSPKYKGNGIARKFNLIIYPFNLWRVTRKILDRPDIIVNDLDCMALEFPFLIASRYNVPIITEIRDLWPESIIDYGLLKKDSLLAKFLYFMEKRMLKKSTKLVYSMEGGKDYIVDKGWDKEHGGPVDLEKVNHICNGVDLEEFDYNKKNFRIPDIDLDDINLFKIIYTGSIRKANRLGLLLDVAKTIKNPKIKFLIWGTGDEENKLKQRVVDEKINNVVFKGNVEKQFVPGLIDRANLSVLNYDNVGVWKYGGSQNKLFDYFAGSTPVITNLTMGYDLLDKYKCGFHLNYSDIAGTAQKIEMIANMDNAEYVALCKNARAAANDYDYKVLAKKLATLIEMV